MRLFGRRSQRSLLWQHQFDPEGVLDFYRPTIHRVRLVFPTLESTDHCAIHERQTLEDAAGVHCARGGDDALDYHRALHFAFKRFVCVLRIGAGDLLQLDIALIDFDSFWGRPSDVAPESPADDSADDSSHHSANDASL